MSQLLAIAIPPTATPRVRATPTRPAVHKTPTPPATSPTINYIQVDSATFDSFNPLVIENSPVAKVLSQPGSLISRAWDYLFPISGGILFVMLIIASFELMGKKTAENGKNRATAAFWGFVAFFCLYWGAQLVQFVFKIRTTG